MVRRPLAAVIALLAGLLPALAQIPSTLPANTVVGRLGVTAGRPQAIPFADLFGSCPQGLFVGGYGTGAAATLRCQATTGIGDVRMYPASGQSGSAAWPVLDPYGSPVTTTSTTSQGLQEAINAALTGIGTTGHDLSIVGGDVSTGGAIVLNQSGTVSFPAMQGKKIRIGAVTLNWGSGITDPTVPGLQFDACMMGDFELAGGQVVYQATGIPVLFKPQNYPPQDHAAGKVIVDCRFRGSTWGATQFNFTGSGSAGVAATEFDFSELNAGDKTYAWRVPAIPAGANYSGNRISIRHLHGIGNGGKAYEQGTGRPAVGQQMAFNRHDLHIALDGSTADGVHAYGDTEFWKVSLTGATSGVPFTFHTGALANILLYQNDTGAAPVDSNGTASTNTVIQGGKAITFGGNPYAVQASNYTVNGLTYFIAAPNGVGQVLSSTPALTNGQLVVGKTSDIPQNVTMSGDATISNTGVLTIANDAVTYAKMQNVSATSRLLGRVTAGAGDPEELTASQALDFVGSTRGNILFRGASGWINLSPGTSGLPLLSQGVGADPIYAQIASAALNITTTSCTNQFVTAISSGGVGTCTTATLAGAQYANQGTTTTVLHGNASGNPSWAAVSLTADISGTLGVGNGGTGIASYAIGDLLYASGATTLSKLADVATGNALISGGLTTAPAWGKIGLTTHISGTLGVGNGGTGTATAFTQGSAVFAGASGVYTEDNANFFYDATNHFLSLGVGSAPRARLDILASGTVNTNADVPGTVNVVGPGTAPTTTPQLSVGSNDAFSAGAIATIAFQGRYLTGSTASANFAAIEGGKENTTTGNLQGQLSFYTRNVAGNFLLALGLDSSQNLTSVATIRANTGFSANGTAGTSATIAVRNGAGAASCNLVVTFGLVTSTTC